MKRIALMLAIAAALSTASACYGSYSAFHKVHRWNETVTGNKVANSAVHLGLWILPVYELLLIGDFFIFNTIEFVTDKPVF